MQVAAGVHGGLVKEIELLNPEQYQQPWMFDSTSRR